jgi:hypothetical protein
MSRRGDFSVWDLLNSTIHSVEESFCFIGACHLFFFWLAVRFLDFEVVNQNKEKSPGHMIRLQLAFKLESLYLLYFDCLISHIYDQLGSRPDLHDESISKLFFALL